MARKQAAQQQPSPETTEEQNAIQQQESPSAETTPVGSEGHQQSHAAAVGKKPYPLLPDPYPIAIDVLAGVTLSENRQARRMEIQFSERPSEEVLTAVKHAGFRWSSKEAVWSFRLNPDSAMTTRIDAERMFKEVAGMIRQERGLSPSSPGISA